MILYATVTIFILVLSNIASRSLNIYDQKENSNFWPNTKYLIL